MPQVYKKGAFVEDRWSHVAIGEGVPAAGHVILPLEWWKAERDAFAGSNVPLGLRIDPGTPLKCFADDVHRFSLLALVFPKFGDGRAFSTARLLRERLGFEGELRAVGDVLFDELQHMVRCGFDSFEISDPATQRLLREGRRNPLAHFYQAGAGPEIPLGTRPWLRSRSSR
jgi:phosphoadenosine phosphosulfate reductase